MHACRRNNLLIAAVPCEISVPANVMTQEGNETLPSSKYFPNIKKKSPLIVCSLVL
jgi:hypothetical protein